MATDYSIKNFRLSLKNLSFPFSTFQEPHTLTSISKLFNSKLSEIDTKTKELINETEDRKKTRMILIAKNIKQEEESKKKAASPKAQIANNDYFILKLSKSTHKPFKSKPINKKSNNPSKTVTSFFMTNLWNNKAVATPKSNSSKIQSPSHVASPYQINKRNINTSTSLALSQSQSQTQRQFFHSASCKTFTSPLKAKYKFITDTLSKSIKESNRFNRNLTFYMNEQRKNRVSKSFPKKEKTRRELELEGKYAELTEKMKFTSSSFKEHYISYKNTRTGHCHVIRSGFADLMSYIDHYSKMEDALFFKYKNRVAKMYPVIQEAADIKALPNEEEFGKSKSQWHSDKADGLDNWTFNERDISPTTKKMRDLVVSVQMRKNRLINRLNENIEMNKQFE